MSDEFQRPDDATDTGDGGDSSGGQGILHYPNSEDQKQTSANYQDASQYQPPPLFIIGSWRRFSEWWTDPYRPRGNFPEHVTVAVSIVIAVIAYFQWGVYRQQKRIMEDSGKQTQQLIDAANIQKGAAVQIAGAGDRSATAAGGFSKAADRIDAKIGEAEKDFQRMAKAAEDNAAQTKRSLDATIEQARLDQRAWVGFVGMGNFEVKSGVPLPVFSIQVKNNGKTPALQFASHVMIRTFQKNEQFQPLFTAPNTPASIDVLQPNMEVLLNTATGNAIVTDIDIARLHAKEVTLYVFGLLTYTDVFKRLHQTTFCVYVDPLSLKSVLTCGTYNTAD
jgi:hypothetical protein